MSEQDASSVTFSHSNVAMPAGAGSMSSPGTVGGQTAISSESSYARVTTPARTEMAQGSMTPAMEETPTGRGTKHKALEDQQRIESPTPPKSPRSAETLALEDLPSLPQLEDLMAPEVAWPLAPTESEAPSPIETREDKHFRVKSELKAEVIRQEARAQAAERSKAEAIRYIESTVYREIESMSESIKQRDRHIRMQEEMLHGQGETIQQMTLEDEGATYRCVELERMNTMSQEVAIHLRNKVMAINEEFSVQGQAAEYVYHEADTEIQQMRLNLELANRRYANARSELESAARNHDEMKRQHAMELFKKEDDRQTAVREKYEQEAINRGSIFDLQRKYILEERGYEEEMQLFYQARNEIHDAHLEMNEIIEQKRTLETQIMRHQTFRDEIEARGNLLAVEDGNTGNSELVEEVCRLREEIQDKDEQIQASKQTIQMYHSEQSMHSEAAFRDGTFKEMEKAITVQSNELRTHQHTIKERNEECARLRREIEVMERVRDINGHIDLGTVQNQRKKLEQRILELENMQSVIKGEHLRMTDEIKAGKEREHRFRKQYDVLFGQSRKLQDKVLELKSELQASKTKTVITTYQNEAAAKGESADELTPRGSKTFTVTSTPPGSNLPKAESWTGPQMGNEMIKLRRELEEALARKDMYKGYWQQSEQYADEEAEESQRLRDEANENKAESSLTPTQKSSSGRQKEAEKIAIPQWPKVADLQIWKTRVLTSVLIACGDNDQSAWGTWLGEAMADRPDMDALSQLSDRKFQSIDAKLSVALSTMIDNAGEAANDVKQRLHLRLLERGKSLEYVKGREILAMIIQSFKTTSHTEVMYNSQHLHEMSYPGDAKLSMFYHRWIEMLANMKPEDRPSETTLRDVLYRKLEHNSPLMKLDLFAWDNLLDDDPRKTRESLQAIMKRHIEKNLEKQLYKEREKAMHNFTNFSDGKKSAAAESDPKPKPKAKPKADPKPKAAAPSREKTPDPKPTVPIYPSPNPKRHAKGDGKGKKGKRGRSRSPSAPKKDPSKTPCVFHFEKNGCRKGTDCPYSHSKSVYDASKSRKDSRSKSPKGSRARSSTPSSGKTGPCWLFQQGKCKHGDKCKFQHVTMPATNPSPRGSKAAPVVVDSFFMSGSDDDYYHNPAVANRKPVKKIRWKRQPDIITYECPDLVDGMPSTQTNRGKGKLQKPVDEESLLDTGRKRQCSLDSVIARAKGMLMDLSGDMSKLKEVRIILGSNTDDIIFYRVVRDPNNDTLEFIQTIEEVRRSCCMHDEPEITCLTVPILERDRRFILDSGSGHDLISERKAERMELDTQQCDEICFHTANGTTSTNTHATIDLGTFTKKPLAYVLKDTPSVMSLGKRCMDEGYSFIRDYIPYISLGSPECEPINDAEAKAVSHLLALPQGARLPSSDKRIVYIDENSGHESEDVLPDDVPTEITGRRRKLHKKARKKHAPKASPTKVSAEDEDLAEELGLHDEPEPGSIPPPSGVPGGVDPPPSDVPGGVEDDLDVIEDDEGQLEVDIVDGDTRLARRGTLKHEAKTLVHLLTHRFKNPYCESCVRAKMKHFKTNRGAFRRSLKKFGDLVTFDIVDSKQVAYDEGVALEREVFVIRDRYTGMIGAYPSRSIDRASVIRAFKQFIGNRKVTMAYSDKAPQFESAFKEMKVTLDHSVPGRPQTNSLAERNNQFILTTTTTCLLEAGLPPCFWRKAIQCVCHLLNVEPGDDDLSAWCKMHGKDFKGEKIPFGALVFFKPSGARSVDQGDKFDPKAIPGVFAGYNLGSGNHWNRQYRCWELADFTKQNLSYDTSRPAKAVARPHITEKVVMHQPLTFPLKQMYEYMNTTLEGLKEHMRLDGDPIYIDDIDDDDDEDGDGDDDDRPRRR